MSRNVMMYLIGALLLSVPLRAAHAQIESGRAIDDSTLAPLVGSRVILQQHDTTGAWKGVETTQTDAQGLFQFMQHAPGVYRVALLGRKEPVYFGAVDTLAADSMQQREFRLPVVRRGVASAYLASEVDHPAQAIVAPSGTSADPADVHLATTMTQMTTQFVVGADGMADPSTFRVVGASNTSTEDSMRQALMSRRFRPATIGGIPVPQVMQEVVRRMTRVQVIERQ